MPSRSEGWGGLFKDEQYRLIRSASRMSVRNALRADFEQTAPPSLREGTPPDSGGEWGLFQTPVGQHALKPAFVESPTDAGRSPLRTNTSTPTESGASGGPSS